MTPKELKNIRKSLGLSITDMAKSLHTPRGTYIKWERGENRVPGILEIAVQLLGNN